MIVVVAEKPSVGRDIARVLKCTEKGDGFIKGSEYTITWAVGHLVTLCEPQEIDPKYKRWRKEDLPILPENIPAKVIPGTRKQFQVIKRLLTDKETTGIVCATDAGREGELIFRLIYAQCGVQKPVNRLWISSMTDAAILEGFEKIKPMSDYDGLFRSAESRSQADWLVGMNASRAFTLSYQVLLSVGRVQTPTLAILVKRAKEIKAFVPEEYYTLQADFGDYLGQWFQPKADNEKSAQRISDKETADLIAKAIRKKEGIVSEVSSEAKRELPPQLFDLTSLQREANKKLGFIASKTLKVAQSLYETRKAITYPRTDSRYLPDDMMPRVQQMFKNLPTVYQKSVEGLPFVQGKLPFSKRIFDKEKVTDHHAIIPTSQKINLTALDKDEQALYDMIAKRTIAVFYPAYEYEAVKVVTTVGDHCFKTTGRVISKMGWRDVYTFSTEKDEEDSTVPSVKQGDRRTVQGARVKKEATKPPPPHTDASLLSSMENAGKEIEDEELREKMKGSGLGTPATRAAVIERLISVGYAQRKGKALVSTEKGEQLIEVVPPEIASPEMTGKWEKALFEIAENKRDTARFMDGIKKLAVFLVDYAQNSKHEVQFEAEARQGKGSGKTQQKLLQDVVCPLCGQKISENEKAFGCTAWKEGCHFTIWKNALVRGGGPLLSDTLIVSLLKNLTVKGSTGVISLHDGKLGFTPSQSENPSISVSIVYDKQK